MPFSPDRETRVTNLLRMSEAREQIKSLLIEAFTVDEIGAMFDAMPDPNENFTHVVAYRSLLVAVGEAWAEHPDRKGS